MRHDSRKTHYIFVSQKFSGWCRLVAANNCGKTAIGPSLPARRSQWSSHREICVAAVHHGLTGSFVNHHLFLSFSSPAVVGGILPSQLSVLSIDLRRTKSYTLADMSLTVMPPVELPGRIRADTSYVYP